MEATKAQYARTAAYFPVQRGNVSLSNRQVRNAILYVAEHGCKSRGLSARFGNWHTVYMRMNRWSKNGVPLAAGSLRTDVDAFAPGLAVPVAGRISVVDPQNIEAGLRLGIARALHVGEVEADEQAGAYVLRTSRTEWDSD